MNFTVMLQDYQIHSLKTLDSRFIRRLLKFVCDVSTPQDITRPFWGDATRMILEVFSMFYGHPGILQTEFSCESNCKTEVSQAFMARNVKERGFLVDHLMDLIQRCARSPIPKTWTERWETLWYELLKMGWNFVFVFVCTTWKHDWLLCQWSFTASKLRHWTTGPLHADVRMRLLWEAPK